MVPTAPSKWLCIHRMSLTAVALVPELNGMGGAPSGWMGLTGGCWGMEGATGMGAGAPYGGAMPCGGPGGAHPGMPGMYPGGPYPGMPPYPYPGPGGRTNHNVR